MASRNQPTYQVANIIYCRMELFLPNFVTSHFALASPAATSNAQTGAGSGQPPPYSSHRTKQLFWVYK
ncbi:hypothetical protein DdX_17957 [Ditylenchus destructor]|uniref:Uncharacterized protein n=1 Tax=Ditylenchus destructor TaxID=166010 RepID=A0AAD4MMF9_9BILA|nr:hypothetical protein DdX_17957 [Ditylenchus destructor]